MSTPAIKTAAEVIVMLCNNESISEITRRVQVTRKAEEIVKMIEAQKIGGWWVVDHARNNEKKRGPFTHAETAGAVRTEMETNASEKQTWNLWVVQIVPEVEG